MAYINEDVIVYDWFYDLYAWDTMTCMKCQNRCFSIKIDKLWWI